MKTKFAEPKIKQKNVGRHINFVAVNDNPEKDDFLTSLARAEEDIRCGRVHRLTSLRDLRK